MPKEKNNGLADEQVAFITNKVEELGSYGAVCKFYKYKDDVSFFAKKLAIGKFGYGDDEDEEPPEKPKSRKKAKKEQKTVKRKRKIDVDEVLDDD